MKLVEALSAHGNDYLKKLVKLVGGPSRLNRKDDLVMYLAHELLSPQQLRNHWNRLDDLSQKVIAATVHNDGVFDADAFVAQYGELPKRPDHYGWNYIYNPIAVDLFIHRRELPEDLMPLLAEIVPPPDRFEIVGLDEAPATFVGLAGPVALLRADTERAGLHDLAVLLRLIDQRRVKLSFSSERLTPGTVATLAANLLEGDFFPLPQKPDQVDSIRLFGLPVFASAAEWVAHNSNTLTEKGRAFLRTQDPALLLEAFETWMESGSFDELTRITALRGLRSRTIRLTKPGERRAQIVEALSWCPVGVWIPIEEFYRALKIWHFDFDLEEGREENLYMGYGKEVIYYGWSDQAGRWLLTKGLYVNVVLWEYLGSIGALDLLYVRPEEADFPAEAYYFDEDAYSRYDGLKYFRINPLGAYLFGQATEYMAPHATAEALFTISPDRQLTLLDPAALTPSLEYQLHLTATPEGAGRYRLNTELLLTALEEGGKFEELTSFLAEGNRGPLPQEVTAWLDQVERNSKAFRVGAQALYIKTGAAELTQLVLDDEVLGAFCHRLDSKTVVLAANREKTLRNRLKELGYGVKGR